MGSTVELGGHKFHSEFWDDVEITDRPPIWRCNANIDVGLTFDIQLVAGAASDPSARERFFGSYRRGSAAERVHEVEANMWGLSFPGLRFEALSSFGPTSMREVYLSDIGLDLVVFSYAINRTLNPNEDE
jgi:hypothetical protein